MLIVLFPVFPFCLVRHRFVNEVYDNFEGMAMSPFDTRREYAEPVITSGTCPPGQAVTGQDNVAYCSGMTHLLTQVLDQRGLLLRLL